MVSTVDKIKINTTTNLFNGDNFNGPWIYKGQSLVSEVTIAGNNTKQTMSLANYLPDSTYDYEVLIQTAAWTEATSGSIIELQLDTGSTTTNLSQRVGRAVARSNNSQYFASSLILPIYHTDQNVTLVNSASGTATYSIYLRGYRRIGKNIINNDSISKFNIDNKDYYIYGNFLDGAWIQNSKTLYEGVLTSHQIVSVDLSQFGISNNDYDYLIRFFVYGDTGIEVNKTTVIRIGQINGYSSNTMVCSHRTSTAGSTMKLGGNLILPLTDGNRIIYISNSGAEDSGTMHIIMRAYKRLGING